MLDLARASSLMAPATAATSAGSKAAACPSGMGKLVVPRAASSGVRSPSGSVSMTPCRHSARERVLGH